MLFTHALIIEALRKEPLAPGMWVEHFSLQAVGTCNVCAVGAVLRHAFGMTNLRIFQVAPILTLNEGADSYTDRDLARDAADGLVAEKNYLGALSVWFEHRADAVFEFDLNCGAKMPLDHPFREEMVQWVTENLPESFEVDEPSFA